MYNEHRARFPLGLGYPSVDLQSSSSCTEHVDLQLKFLRLSFGACLQKTARARAHVHVAHVACCHPRRGDTHGVTEKNLSRFG